MIPKMRQFVDQQNSRNTQLAYERDLRAWSAWSSARREVGVELAVAYKKHLLANYAQATARRMFGTVRAYFRWLHAQNPAMPNPFSAVKGPVALSAAPRIPSDADVDRMVAAVDTETLIGKRDLAVLTLLLNGLRAQEVCDLRVSDARVTRQPCVMRVVGKGQHERFVPLTDEAATAIRSYVRTRDPLPDEWLIEDIFPDRPITRHVVSYVVEKYARLAGVQGVSPHSFRHHYATRLYRATRDVIGVGKLLGHAKPETTMMYARLDLSDIVETARHDPRYHEA